MTVVHALLSLVCGRIRDTCCIQALGDTEHACPADKPIKNVPHDGCCFFVDQQAAVVIRVFAVAIGRK